ncbi:Rv3235 family protein [Quadrisphaera sp. DSM 44207]|uniref:Rv3235 family protein n=1 Tax=Quadrisphaera sp. DSM 44207 TaxID=1881057 RepID=UPI00087F6BBF|nr:Rv3235 family protein [Quadrisphaera sp. DSM 44207]SDQ08861.1 hypothetical protein SAMN05428996_0461 [Quadrisphaera sp. DSM 44207]
MSAPAPAPRPLRVLPVPVAEPHPLGAPRRPRAQLPAGQGVLALGGGPSTVGAPAPPPGRPSSGPDPFFSPQPTPASALPDPGGLVPGLVQATVEVLSGARPAAQLLRWLSADVYAGLQRRAALTARVRGARTTAPRAHVRRVHLSSPRDGVVEGAAVVRDGERVRAVALRLEGLDGRWRVTALEVG